MKTSNKLLLTLAVLLIVIPILAIAINVKVNYRTANMANEINVSLKQFEKQSEGYDKQAIRLPFDKIRMEGFENLLLDLTIVKDKNFGLKSKNDTDHKIEYLVDENKTLIINLKKIKSEKYNTLDLYIYAPNMDEISVNNFFRTILSVNTETLKVNTSKAPRLSFGNGTHIKNLIANLKDSTDFQVSDKELENLNLQLDNSSFTSESGTYKLLNISAKGNSTVQINNVKKNEKPAEIEELNIETFGSASLNFGDVKIKKFTGDISDSTTVLMPAFYIKQLYKK